MSGTLSGRVVIVTGAASGIGAAAAGVLAAAGARVVAADVDEAGGRAVVEGLQRAGAEASFVRADVGDESDVKRLVEAALDLHGALHGAFNNAGIVQRGKPLHELSTEEFERALRVDLTSVFWCIKYQVPAMRSSGGGSIVNTASSLGQVAIRNAAEYVAAKHGVVGLTRAAAAEYGGVGIRVNAVLPGITLTPVISKLSENSAFAAFMEKLIDRHPIGRFGQPAEIARAVEWLLSDAASFVNGAALPVDGGYLAI